MQIKTNIHHTKRIEVRRKFVESGMVEGPFEVWEVTITTKDGDDYTVMAFTDRAGELNLKVDTEDE